MFKIVWQSYLDTIRLFKQKPQVILAFVFLSLISVSFAFRSKGIEINGYNGDTYRKLSEIFSWLLFLYSYWVIFRFEGHTDLTLGKWFWSYFPRSLLQIVGGFFLFMPAYLVLWSIAGGREGLAFEPLHSILNTTMAIWFFVSISMGTLWLFYRNEGFFGNIRNAIKDVFRNFGVYFLFRLITIILTLLSWSIQSNFVDFTSVPCGMLMIFMFLIYVSWMALVYGFLHLRKLETASQLSNSIDQPSIASSQPPTANS